MCGSARAPGLVSTGGAQSTYTLYAHAYAAACAVPGRTPTRSRAPPPPRPPGRECRKIYNRRRLTGLTLLYISAPSSRARWIARCASRSLSDNHASAHLRSYKSTATHFLTAPEHNTNSAPRSPLSMHAALPSAAAAAATRGSSGASRPHAPTGRGRDAAASASRWCRLG